MSLSANQTGVKPGQRKLFSKAGRHGMRKGGRLWRAHDRYSAAVLVYLVMAFTVEDEFWPIMVLNYLTHLLLPVAFILLPVALIRRRWGSVAIESACAVAFIFLFGSDLIGREPARAAPGGTPITIVTYNLGDGLVGGDDLEAFLQGSGADIIGLVEVTPSAMLAATAIIDTYPYQEVRDSGNTGKALLSKYPIERAEWFEFNLQRPDLLATVNFKGTRIAILVAHPPPLAVTLTGIKPREGTKEQIDSLIKLIEAIREPLIVVGDFNFTQMHDTYQRLEDTGLQDAFREVGDGLGLTAPNTFPLISDTDSPLNRIPVWPLARIDYIWASEEWQPVDAWVERGAGSDHRPVFAVLSLIESR